MKPKLRFFKGATFLLLLSTLNPQLSTASAQGTAFTYQGRLNDGANPANGIYDLRFTIYDSTNQPGTVVAGPLTNSAVGVSNGLFTVTLDFGTGVFSGANRWLDIGVRTNGTGSFAILTPRQPMTPTPYAITAGNVTGPVSSSQLNGPVPLASLPTTILVTNGQKGVNFTGTFSGNGAGVTNVVFGALNPLGALTWGNFLFSSSPGVSNGPVSVVAADVNGDGKPDLISADKNANVLTILINNGNGGFLPAIPLSVGNGPESVLAADVNGDGKPDLISANSTSFTLTILTNNGSGGFAVASSPGVGDFPYSLAAADVNGDGKVDLIVANLADSNVSVLTNNGSGGFAISSSPGTGPVPDWVIATDVNGDGKMDLVTANNANNTLTVLINNGGGGFTIGSSPVVGTAPAAVAAADVNGDGWADLISANSGTNTLTVLTNNGSGFFVLSSALTVGVHPDSVSAADVNGDGKVDLISANQVDNTLTVVTNDSRGGFASSASLAVGAAPGSVITADLNGDSRLDLVDANYSAGTLTILFNRVGFVGDGSGLTGLSASQISSGTLADARLSADVALLDANETFTSPQAFTGDVAINPPADLSFGTGSGRQMLNLWATAYGIGIQSYAQYYRVDYGAGFFWYEGGVHSGAHGDPGTGGVTLMSLESNGQLTVPGMTQFGSGTGDAEAPDKGIIVRRVKSTALTAGSVIARTDKLTLERDGTFGGLRIVNVASPGTTTFAATGVTGSGTTVSVVTYLPPNAAAGTNTVFSDAQNVVYFRCSFGEVTTPGQLTEVSLIRSPYNITWSGTLTSTFNQ